MCFKLRKQNYRMAREPCPKYLFKGTPAETEVESLGFCDLGVLLK